MPMDRFSMRALFFRKGKAFHSSGPILATTSRAGIVFNHYVLTGFDYHFVFTTHAYAIARTGTCASSCLKAYALHCSGPHSETTTKLSIGFTLY